MSEQTTAAWVESVLETELSLIPLMVGVDADSADIGGMDAAARIIAVRIDRLTAERDEARAEVERLRLPAEAWEAREQYLNYQQFGATAEYRDAALRECHRKDAAARAREAAKEGG